MNNEKLKNNNLLIIVIASSFIGGVIGTTLSLQIFKPDDKLMELLLNWPFLSFLLVIFIVTIFYDSIKLIITERDLKIKSGDNELAIIRQIVEKETSSQLDDQLSNSNGNVSDIVKEPKTDSLVISKIKEIFNIQSDELANIIFHLGTSQFKWRSLKALSKRTGFDDEKIDRYVRANPELIIRSIGIKSGKGIYRLTDKKQLLFEEKINNSL